MKNIENAYNNSQEAVENEYKDITEEALKINTISEFIVATPYLTLFQNKTKIIDFLSKKTGFKKDDVKNIIKITIKDMEMEIDVKYSNDITLKDINNYMKEVRSNELNSKFNTAIASSINKTINKIIETYKDILDILKNKTLKDVNLIYDKLLTKKRNINDNLKISLKKGTGEPELSEINFINKIIEEIGKVKNDFEKSEVKINSVLSDEKESKQIKIKH